MKKPTTSLSLAELAKRVEALLPDPSLPEAWSRDDAVEMLAADLGDYEMLRRRYPDNARHLNPPPKPTRGKYARKPKERPYAVVGATADVPRIRAALKSIYGRARPPFNAVEVAAEIWGADITEIEKLLKPSGKKPPR